MAGWISSKLKVAETLLQQIDQQAAESLGKNDKPRSDELNFENPTKTSEVVPLKDQLKKKTPETNDLIGKLRSDHNLNVVSNNNNITNNNRDRDKEVSISVNFRPSTNPKSTLTDSDWTELLSVPSHPTPLAVNRSNGVSGIRGLRKDGRRRGNSGSNVLALETKRNQKTQNSVLKLSPKSNIASENIVNGGGLGGRRSDREDSRFPDSMRRTSSVEVQSEGKDTAGRELDWKDASADLVVEHKNEANEEKNGVLDALGDGGQLHTVDCSMDAIPQSTEKNKLSEIVLTTVDVGSDLKMGLNDDPNKFSNIEGSNEYNVGPRRSASLKRGSPSASDGCSDLETDSASKSDSESDDEREERSRRRGRRREKILAEKKAAKAVEAIKERENMVARLEGEKQSLEKILEERAKQHAQEASELQTSTMEMMEAVELEKQKHNNTRMEALTRLAKFETANADLARSLATAQWNLEVEVNQVSELRQQIELREATHEDLRRKISNTHQTGNKLVTSKGVEFEREILEAEYSFITDKVGRLQEKAKTLETNIEMTQKERENPTEVEIELKQRLGQLTDHLIQKQAQVEALSSEKATLLFRIEAVSRLLDESKSMPNAADFSSTSSRDDLETGVWELSNSKLRPLFEERIRSGRQHLGSLVRQLDSIFCAGAVFLRRNSTARLWSLVYLVCLHLWVLYILKSHSPVSDEARSGAIVSLENINNTGGV
uniref:Putative golgin candidate 2 n=1 Tax=Davidia involucrata TaxID=16924 RepID=A0A5B7B8J6_DAVIN